MKIVNIKKFIRGVLLILFLTILILLLLSNKIQSFKEIKYEYFTVSYGDTLWNIAIKLRNKSKNYEGKDIRYIIDDLIQLNNLSSSNINENQQLKYQI